MDIKNEDTMVHQIETNLTDMNDNLFHTGKISETNRVIPRKEAALVRTDHGKEKRSNIEEYPLVSNEYITESPSLTRAEYIRLARESCLRQLSNEQIYSRPYDVNYMDPELLEDQQLTTKKTSVMRLFHNDSVDDPANGKTPEHQLASYRSIVIRSACAIILFLSIFAFDKFNVKIGQVSNKVIQEYVTGNDILKDLENIVVGWLK